MSFPAAFGAASLIFWIVWPLVMTIIAWILTTRWVDRRFGRGWAVSLGLTLIPLASYAVMFTVTFWIGRLLIWLGLG
jgi:hypothetical protein